MEEKIILEIHDKAKETIETVELQFEDGVYYTKIEEIPEAYKYMLPGDTITIVYAIFDDKKEHVDTFEVDYTFPESRLHTHNALKEENTPFDRIVTYSSDINSEYEKRVQKISFQQLYEDVKTHKMTTFRHNRKKHYILLAEMRFYSNYISNRQNIAKKNIIIINSNNEGFKPWLFWKKTKDSD